MDVRLRVVVGWRFAVEARTAANGVEWDLAEEARAAVEGKLFLRCAGRLIGTTIEKDVTEPPGSPTFELMPGELLNDGDECRVVWGDVNGNPDTPLFLVGGRPRVTSVSVNWTAVGGWMPYVAVGASERVDPASWAGAVAAFAADGSVMRPETEAPTALHNAMYFSLARYPELPAVVSVATTVKAVDGRLLDGVTFGGHGDGLTISIAGKDAQNDQGMLWSWSACDE